MEYWCQYILTEREWAKLLSRVAGKDVPVPESAPPSVAEIRSFVRLFCKVWLAGAAARRLTRRNVPAARLSSALVACALSYRFAYRFLRRRANAERTEGHASSVPSGCGSKCDLAKFAAPLSGLLAGYVLAKGLPGGVSLYAAVYLGTKVCEWAYNYGDDLHKFDWKPEILGTWALFPLAFAQLFATFIMTPENCPHGFKRIMALLSNGSLRPRYRPDDVVLEIAQASMKQFPEFRSSLVYQSRISTSRLMTRAHPGNGSVIGALLHPTTDSDMRFFINIVSSNVKLLSKYLLPAYLIRASLGKKSYKEAIISALRTAVTYSMAAASAIGGIQLSQKLLGRKLSPWVRFRVIGFLSGLWAILNQQQGRAQFLYVTRLAVLSLIPAKSQAFVSQALMPVAVAAAFTILNKHPDAVSQHIWRKIGHWVQTGQWKESINDE